MNREETISFIEKKLENTARNLPKNLAIPEIIRMAVEYTGIVYDTRIRNIQYGVYENAVRHGFWEQKDNPKIISEKLCLIHSEISEALEAHRDNKSLNEELADATIRIMDLCEYLGIDLGRAIEEKHKINLNRPYKHGREF